ncbi:hypothetical protein [Dankookia sp. P2]|uniref:hypothetical protein n=1 Tax=Dankookia sp. P2 TaxID=3423955 RepID=UPI003D671DAA
MNPHPRHRRPAGPVLLVAGAFCFWLFVVSALVAVLPDHVASADQPERVAWSGD